MRRASDGLAIGSSRMLNPFKALPCHPEAEFGGGFARPRKAGTEAAFRNHMDDIGKARDLVQIFRDQEHGGTGIACGNQLRVDLGDGADIEPAHRLVRENDLRPRFQHAPQNELLHIAA